MEHTFLKIDQQGPVAVMVLARPPMNAISTPLLLELRAALAGLAGATAVKAVLLTGDGRAFVAGADIAEMKDKDAAAARAYAALGQAAFFDLERLPQPTIAAVNGYALGGGCELAMACDLRIASERATFGLPEVGLGVIPGFGGTQRLSRLVGPGKAAELILTGEIIDAAEAHRIGLVNRVVKAEELLPESLRMADVIASRAETAVRLAKKALQTGLDVDLQSGCALEAEMLARCFATRDQKEGMQAFLEKRKPQFTGS
ncbi:MAG TPA: enoyl-CoA hydratase-related protein [Candidatus Sulfotelmatobacter sp.]|nr:enoyl-CoA hydratase-related protein [Candidatus Sulfotelmatobacter sp.]